MEKKGWLNRLSDPKKQFSDFSQGSGHLPLSSGRYPKDAIQHPLDEYAQHILENRLASQKHLRALLDKAIGELETEFYLENLADNTRVNSDLMPELYGIFEDVCERLQVSPPNLFFDTNPLPNAWTLGADHPSIVVTSGLLQLMNEDELRFIIGHEIGHLLCDHTRYRIMTEKYQLVATLISIVPVVGKMFSTLLQISLNFWYRRAELSADRFGVFSCQNMDSSISALAKLAGGSPNIDPQALKAATLSQANEFRTAYRERATIASFWDIFDGLMRNASVRTHPWPVVRIWEIDHWLESQNHAALLVGDFERARSERNSIESFFVLDMDRLKDPFEAMLAELTGELGKKVGDLLKKGTSFTGNIFRRENAEQEDVES